MFDMLWLKDIFAHQICQLTGAVFAFLSTYCNYSDLLGLEQYINNNRKKLSKSANLQSPRGGYKWRIFSNSHARIYHKDFMYKKTVPPLTFNLIKPDAHDPHVFIIPDVNILVLLKIVDSS